MSGQNIFDAIFENDYALVKALLVANPKLIMFPAAKAKLYEGEITHWIYVGDTPLHLAAATHGVVTIALLLKAGANVNAAGNHRASGPLHYAADLNTSCEAAHFERQTKSVRSLLRAGARIDAQDKNGATALHRAARTRGVGAVKELLAAGADVELKNKSGSTAFHLAVQNTGRGGSGSDAAKAAQREIIKAFLQAGAGVLQKDGKGKTVRDCASNGEVREWLCG